MHSDIVYFHCRIHIPYSIFRTCLVSLPSIPMLLLRPTLPFLTATSFLTSTFLLTHSLAPHQSRRLLLDSASSSHSDSVLSQYQQKAQTPVVQQRDGQKVLNPRAVRQISTGSVIGKPFISLSSLIKIEPLPRPPCWSHRFPILSSACCSTWSSYCRRSSVRDAWHPSNPI